ncbi:MAG: aspartyl protease family protein [Chthoniobacterales bacterium]
MNLSSPPRLARCLAILSFLAVMPFSGHRAVARSPISLDVLQRDGYGSVGLVSEGQNRVYVLAEINGHKVRLLLDTGWGTEGITVGMNPGALNIVPEKGVGWAVSVSGAHVPFAHGTAQSVVMGNVSIRGTPIYFGRVSGEGVVGRGFLKRNNAVIDLTNLRLYLRPPGKGRRVDLAPALTALGMAKAPFFDAPHGNFVLNVEVNGVPTRMILDTGAQATMIDGRFAKMARAKGWGRDVISTDAAGVTSKADFTGPKTFKIDGIPIRTPVVVLDRFVAYEQSGGKIAGLLGLDVIGMNCGIIDVGQQRFYFVRAK